MTAHPDPSVTQLSPVPKQNTFSILLADDDIDDCQLFNDAIVELDSSFSLTSLHNGEQLMKFLNTSEELPDILFLDLNMPRKNGIQCLSEIKGSERLRHLPVVIISTSFEQKIIDLLYKSGAMFYLRKPNEFSRLKKLIDDAIILTEQKRCTQPSIEEYVLS